MNDLDPRLTPAQRFGRELARVRKESGLSQARLGAHLGVSSSLVGHIEIGNRIPKPDLARRCDEIFKTGDLFARLCRGISSPTGPRWFMGWADEIEPRARVLRSWDPLLIPGLLQTEGYARAVFRGGLARSEREVEDQVAARMRRKTIWERDGPPTLWVLIDEWVLRRPIGGPHVMYEQLDNLAAVAVRHDVKIQLVSHETPCTAGLISSFIIAELADAPTAVSVDSAGRGEVSTEHDLVTIIWDRYDRIRAEAHRPGQSLEMIKEARDEWKRKT
ncbi:transcriptional regulator [Microtetraspora sp. NBRC 13810]|uniref:helix-turn-helix domain-containing protein n=1 Tax=Microtetraspora sp. NBRC 13810 TaxID=3030990 RepID=UPI0024A3E5F6|nr:helix-turn-helix transcriptional regulator [Microtetraspora sp. NBRC 13810]GLW05370.1 transcriptional regulator [Microtetraspora sp. NBRC 13810]